MDCNSFAKVMKVGGRTKRIVLFLSLHLFFACLCLKRNGGIPPGMPLYALCRIDMALTLIEGGFCHIGLGLYFSGKNRHYFSLSAKKRGIFCKYSLIGYKIVRTCRVCLAFLLFAFSSLVPYVALPTQHTEHIQNTHGMLAKHMLNARKSGYQTKWRPSSSMVMTRLR